MNGRKYQQTVIEIDPKAIVWGLLSQWKAVVIVSIAMALLVCGYKYHKDVETYHAEIDAQKERAELAKLSVEERIGKVLESLSDEEKTPVLYITREQEWIDEQKKYLNNSILMHTDPTNQRVLKMVYDIDSDEDNLQIVTDSFSDYLKGEAFANAVLPYIDPSARCDYIGDLFYRDDDQSDNIKSGETSSLLKVNLVLPEEADANAVSKAVSKEIEKYSKQLNQKHQNSVSLASEEVAHIYNKSNVLLRMKMYESINLIDDIINDTTATLNEGQKAAIQSINTIKREASKASEADIVENSSDNEITNAVYEIPAPEWSKKYAILGGFLGLLAYASIYIAALVMNCNISNVSNVENYTDERLLGEVYYDSERTGFSKLLHSKIVERFRYREKEFSKEQISRIVDSVEAICKHRGIRQLALIDMTKSTDAVTSNEIIRTMSEIINDRGINTAVVLETEGFNEKRLLDIDTIMLIVSAYTKSTAIEKMLSLCKNYDIINIGSVYLTEK